MAPSVVALTRSPSSGPASSEAAIGPVAKISRTFAVAVRLSATRNEPLATALSTEAASDGRPKPARQNPGS